jgi:tetratricopeptide (TPR) repeat protein
MAIDYQLKERRVIPNWRDYERTLQLGELNNSSKIITANNSKELIFNLSRPIEDWKANQNIGNAADLINSAFVAKEFTSVEVREAMSFVGENPELSSPLLNSLIGQIDNENNNLQDSIELGTLNNLKSIEEFQAYVNDKSFHSLISKRKKETNRYYRNPIQWVELARLYAIKGQHKKAGEAILKAIYLAPNNRYVLRSATRYFIHQGEFDKAIYYLKNALSIKNDPWLISAHIATSSVMNRHSPFIKRGIDLVDSNNYSDFDLTELSSSLGTLEQKNGSFKKAKKFFETSLKSPNDNSLAQIQWIAKDDYRFETDSKIYKNVLNPFEAYSLESYEKGNWEDAFYNSIKWFLDMPFSKRPAVIGGYVASSMLQDHISSILINKVALQSNPDDPILLNNLIFAAAKAGQIDQYLDQLKKLTSINYKILKYEVVITIQATLGLVKIKSGLIDEGIEFYEVAIKNAKNIGKTSLVNHATINLTIELMAIKHEKASEYFEKVKSMQLKDKDLDLKLFKDRVLNLK